jgi:hypothetical protein
MNIIIVAIFALAIGFSTGGLVGLSLARKTHFGEKKKENDPAVNQVDLNIQYPILKLDFITSFTIRDTVGNLWSLLSAGTESCRIVPKDKYDLNPDHCFGYSITRTREQFMVMFPEYAYLYKAPTTGYVTISKEEYESLKPLASAYKEALQELERV